MGRSKLLCFPIHLILSNHYNIVTIGILTGVSVSIDGVCSLVDFEVIEIVDGSTLFLVLLGIDWAFENKTIIDLEKRQMIFEVEDLKVIVLLDSTEGRRCVEPIKGKELDKLYDMTVQMDDYVNRVFDGVLSWRSIYSCVSNSKESLEN